MQARKCPWVIIALSSYHRQFTFFWSAGATKNVGKVKRILNKVRLNTTASFSQSSLALPGQWCWCSYHILEPFNDFGRKSFQNCSLCLWKWFLTYSLLHVCTSLPFLYLVNNGNTLPQRGELVNFELWNWHWYQSVICLDQTGKQRASKKEKKEYRSIRKNYIYKGKGGLLRISEILFLMALNLSIFHFLAWTELPLKSLEAFCKKKYIYMGVELKIELIVLPF